MKYLDVKAGRGPRQNKSLGGPPENKGGGETFNATEGAVELASAAGIDLATVKGTGEGGRITKADVQDAVDAAKK